MPIRLRKFRDPVYNYVYASELENVILRHRLMNRLHEIHQNSTTYLTYPSTHGMRFAHSLGTMHVAGLLLSRAFHLSPAGLVEELSNVVQETLLSADISLADTKFQIFGEDELCNNDGLYRIFHLVPASSATDRALLVFFQAMRLACLVHDIGHPPFSHTTESALRQTVRDYPGHEKVGETIIKHIIDSFAEDHPLATFAHAVFHVTTKLVAKDEPFEKLAEIVSGDIDADRLDYVRRDMWTAGLSLAPYDLGRLLDAARINKKEESQQLEITFTTESLSMIEAFFQARSHVYHYMLWHHNVVRTNLALSRALVTLLEGEESDLVTEAAAMRGQLTDTAIVRDSQYHNYEYFTDSSLVTQLRQLLQSIENLDGGSARRTSNATQTLYRALRVFLRREIFLLPTLWKRPDEFQNFAELVLASIDRTPPSGASPINFLNNMLNTKYWVFVESNKESDPIMGGVYNKDRANLLFSRQIENKLNECVPDKRFWVYYITPGFSPTPKDTFELISPQGEAVNLKTLSPIVSSLADAWMELPHLWLYVEAEQEDTMDINSIRRAIAPSLADFLSS